MLIFNLMIVILINIDAFPIILSHIEFQRLIINIKDQIVKGDLGL